MTHLITAQVHLYDDLINFSLENQGDAGLLIMIRDELEETRGQWNQLVQSLPFEENLL